MRDLPPGWEWSTLAGVLDHTIGGIWGKPNGEDEVDVRILRVTEFKQHTVLNPQTGVIRSVSEKQLSSRQLEVGDVLLEKSGGGPNTPVGRVVAFRTPLPETAVPTNFVQLLRPNREVVDASFLAWTLHWWHMSGVAESHQRATTNIRNLQTKSYLAQPFPVPPLPEQRRIVAAIEEHFSRLDAAEASLRAAVVRCRLLLASAYSEAFEPKAQQQLARDELIRSVELSECLEQLVDHRGKTPGKLGGEFESSGVRVVSAIHIKDGVVKFDERKRFVSSEMFKRWMPVQMRKGDILLTSEAPMGSLARVPDDEPLVLSQRLFGLRARTDLLTNDYLFHFMQSSQAQDQLRRRSSGTTVTGIRQAELRQLSVPLPPLGVQARIVERLTTSRSLVERLMEDCEASFLRARRFRSAILAAAFSGQLVPRDPSDEPATVLIERVAAERVASKPTRKEKAAP